MPEPRLEDEERRLFEQGVAQFNSGHYFECHDTLEEMWAGVRGPSRDFFQGLIQVAVAFYHLSGGNLAGAHSMLARALKRFERYPARYFGFDVAAHRQELQSWSDRITAGEVGELSEDERPTWTFD